MIHFPTAIYGTDQLSLGRITAQSNSKLPPKSFRSTRRKSVIPCQSPEQLIIFVIITRLTGSVPFHLTSRAKVGIRCQIPWTLRGKKFRFGRSRPAQRRRGRPAGKLHSCAENSFSSAREAKCFSHAPTYIICLVRSVCEFGQERDRKGENFVQKFSPGSTSF